MARKQKNQSDYGSDKVSGGSESENPRAFHEGFSTRLIESLEAFEETGEEGESIEIESVMLDAVEARATDIYLAPYQHHYRVRFRIDGKMIDVADLPPFARLDPIPTIRPEGGRFSYTFEDFELDVRVTEAPCMGDDKLAVRLLAPSRVLKDVSGLGFDERELEELRSWLQTIGGLLLVAGPTGSGKTTTLYALLHQLKMTDSHVVMLEEPVEYEIPGINQILINRRQGLDFAVGAPAMLRLDPDYLVIGELTESAPVHAAPVQLLSQRGRTR
ncbi:MAG: ATPase, T2SS/T4P/T4SS family [Wenzhouxiangellaceae bacterium]|nr:ATPase, T2SS/T4P/T4SS family [Wenzhouxiangellaceae bacterium]